MMKFFMAGLMMSLPFFQQVKWTRTKVNDDITLRLPQDFYQMTPSDIAQRYPSVRKPVGAYTNEQRLVDISVKISATQWREEDIALAMEFFKSSIYNLYDQVTMIGEGIETINGKDFAVFEFDSRIEPEASLENSRPVRKYNYVMYLVRGSQTLVFTFQCPIQLKDQWQPLAKEIMDNVKVK